MKKAYKTPEQKRERVQKWHNERREDLNYIKRELGFRVNFPKPINTEGERRRQEKITELWKLTGYFFNIENTDAREKIEEEEFEKDFIEDEDLDEDIEDFFSLRIIIYMIQFLLPIMLQKESLYLMVIS